MIEYLCPCFFPREPEGELEKELISSTDSATQNVALKALAYHPPGIPPISFFERDDWDSLHDRDIRYLRRPISSFERDDRDLFLQKPPAADELSCPYEEYLDPSHYEIIGCLGEKLPKSCVCHVVHKASGKQFALKEGKLDNICHKRELEIFQKCSHPNIVKCYAHFEKNHYLYILLELAEGDLLSLAQGPLLSEEAIRSYFKQIVNAVAYLHEQKIVHRDIKLENILLFKDGVVKLTDFGHAKKIEHSGRHSPRGTIHYAAPELLLSNPYDHRVDFWSLGATLYLLAFNTFPFHGTSDNEIYRKVLTQKIFIYPKANRSPMLVHLIETLMARNLELRISKCEEILSHPWMVNQAKESPNFSTT